MKKDLIITMEEECIECPKVSLITETMYFTDKEVYKIHKCKHLDFCIPVRRHWEEVKGLKDAKK